MGEKKDKISVIGITGTHAAGKDTVADFFKERGFNVYSHSDELRNILKNKKMEITRDNLAKEGNELRRLRGNGVLSELILEKIEFPATILSIRHPDEVAIYRKKLDNFILLSIDAPRRLRYERSVKRSREGEEGETYEDFVKKENRELRGENESQQLENVIKMADIEIINDSDLESLNNKLKAIV